MWPNGLLRFQVIAQGSFPLLHPNLVSASRDSQLYPGLEGTPPVQLQPRSTGDSSAMASHRSSIISQASRQSCCSVQEGKQEVKSLVDNFLREFNGIVSSTFGDAPAAQPRSTSPETVTAEPPNNVDDASDVTVPGAFYRPTYITPKANVPVHQGITCDFCGQRNIRGTRYHCIQCPDYDLVRRNSNEELLCLIF